VLPIASFVIPCIDLYLGKGSAYRKDNGAFGLFLKPDNADEATGSIHTGKGEITALLFWIGFILHPVLLSLSRADWSKTFDYRSPGFLCLAILSFF